MTLDLGADTLGRAACIAGVTLLLVLAVVGMIAGVMFMLMVVRDSRSWAATHPRRPLRLPTGNRSKAGTPKPRMPRAL